MNFGFSEEQELLRGEVRKFLDARCSLAEVRNIAASTEGYSPSLWKQVAELGWVGLGLPETYGGAGLCWEDRVLLLEETGRSLFPSPLLASGLAGAVVLDAGDAAQRARWLPAIADGTCIATVAIDEAAGSFGAEGVALRANADGDGDGWRVSGEKGWVADAPCADAFVVAARSDADELLLLWIASDAVGLRVEPIELLDATKRAGHLQLDGVRVSASDVLASGADAERALARHLACGAVSVAAEACGAAEAALELTVQYAKDRIQFGSPIGRYQGVKHPLADRYVDVESLKSLVYHAAWALDRAADEVEMAAAKAKAFASEMFLQMGVDGIQLHGAVGYTEEYDIQLYLKRSKWARPMFGDEDHHFDRIAQLGGL